MVSKIGPFEILEPVGRGAMGSVYRALDPMIGRLVAIKVIRLIGYNDGDEAAFLKDRLLREAKAAGSLSHPGIVTIYQVGICDDQAYIAMEYIDGLTLQQQLASESPVPPSLFRRVVTEAAAALDYAHSRGVVHRDVKPANIMIAGSGAVKVTDFGIAKTMLGHTQTQTGTILGTPFYMSPEQVEGKVLDGRSDQFALAVMGYEMLTGRRPFNAEQVTSICYQIVHADPPSPMEVNPELGTEVVRVLKKALAKDPNERFNNCSEFAVALVKAYEDGLEQARARRIREEENARLASTPALVPPKPPIGKTRTAVARHYPAVIVAVGVAMLLVVLAIVLSRQQAIPHVQVAAPVAAIRENTPSKTPQSGPATKAINREPQGQISQKKATPVNYTATKPPKPARPEDSITSSVEQPRKPAALVAQGRLVWTGTANRGALLEISGGRASIGTLYGRLPGVPISVEVFPADNSIGALAVFTSDEKYAAPAVEPTPFGAATFSWDPRHATDLTLWEEPGPSNDWGKLVLRVNAAKLTACVVQWKRKVQ